MQASFRCLFLFALAAYPAYPQTANWTPQSPKTSPPARTNHAMVFDAARGQVVLFGGNDVNSVYLNDTWIWDGLNWTQKSPATSPSARVYHAMAYDAATGQVLLFGGVDPNFHVLGDIWAWDGSNWTQKSPAINLPPRFHSAVTYDAIRGQILVFGGEVNSATVNETWAWDGSNWFQKNPKTSPPARHDSAMAFDGGHNQVVLFAGQDVNGQFINDTWIWDGLNWTLQAPAVFPPLRASHAMAFDAAHSQTVLFGGFNAQGPLNDTWTWDGSKWTQQFPQAVPPARKSQVMVYDSSRNQVVMFGGFGSTALGDTWIWTGGTAASLPQVTNVISASGFGGFASASPGSWVEIYGSNLANDTRQWAGSDFTGNNAPTALDGVTVSIGGQKAFVDYIASSPGQVNAQLPSNIATGGPLALTVTNGAQTSAPFNITINTAQPGLLAPSSFLIGGKQYVVALLPDGATYILPTGAISGVTSRPAHPGETIMLYGIGFGGVTPAIPAGQIVTQSNQLAASLRIAFGQTAAQIPYAGLAPGFVGLYQFNVVVPAVPDGDLVPVTFTLGGVAGTQTLFISVHQ